MKIEGVHFKSLPIFKDTLGSVYRALRKTESEYCGFGEVYFSTVEFGKVKGWKKHTSMTMNLIVPSGKIRFYFFDDRTESPTRGVSDSIELSPENYGRLTIKPGVWVAFRGNGEGTNLLMNFADMIHDPLEAINVALDAPHMPKLEMQ